LPKKGHSCKEASEPVHVQFSHYDAEQKNFVPQEELIQRLQEENRQLRSANAAILRENQELHEKVKQLSWRLQQPSEAIQVDNSEYPVRLKFHTLSTTPNCFF
jgi:predicted RNase H-like nuclease (RuvC/YqgF family)